MPSSSSNNSKAPMANKEIEKLVNKYSSSSTRRSSSSRLNASVPNFNFHHTNNDGDFHNSTRNNTNDLLMSASSSNVFNNSNDPLQYVAGRRQNSRRRSSRNLQQQQQLTTNTTGNNKAPLRHSNSATEDSVTTSTTGRTTPTRASVSSSFLENTSTAAHPSLAPDWATSNYATNKYIHRPASFEDEHALLQLESPSQSASADDPLAAANNNMGFVMTDDDKFEDEMLDEIEMTRDRCANFVNLGDMEAAGHIQRRRRRQRFLVLTVCCLIFVGVVLAIVFAVQLTQKNNQHPKQRQVVPFASKRLKLLCAEALDLGPGQSATFPLQVPKDCQVACLQAECCWNPNSIYQCTPETQQYCDIYQASCTIMLPDNPDYSHDDNQAGSTTTTSTPTHVVPGAPATLKTTCVPVGSSLSVTQVCHDVCALGDCCWNTTSTMTCTADSQQRNCPPYKEYCSALNTHAPQQQQSNTNTNTNGGGTKAPFPAASTDLATICAISTMEQNGARLCQEQCAQAECCWKVGTVNCASSVPNQMCHAYANACAVLNNLSSALPNHNGGTSTTTPPLTTSSSSSSEMPFPPAPEGLSVYCDPGEMEEISLRTCQDKCSPAECCWSTKEGVSDCPASVSPEVCQPYAQACAILNDLVTFPGGSGEPTSNNNNVPVAPGDLAQRCAKDNIIGSENGGDLLIECERECLAASCCWQPNADTPCTNNGRCAAYAEPCSIFVGLFGGSSSSSSSSSSGSGSGSGSTTTTTTTTATTTSSGVPEAPSDLATTCSPDVLKTSVNNGEYIVKCEKECLAAACCWKESASNACPGADGCEPYMEPCGTNLIAALEALEGQTGSGSGTTTVTDSPSSANSEQAQEIAKACNDKVAFFVKPRCENACSPGACCFEDTTACSAGVDCGIFAPCSVLDRRMLRH